MLLGLQFCERLCSWKLCVPVRFICLVIHIFTPLSLLAWTSKYCFMLFLRATFLVFCLCSKQFLVVSSSLCSSYCPVSFLFIPRTFFPTAWSKGLPVVISQFFFYPSIVVSGYRLSIRPFFFQYFENAIQFPFVFHYFWSEICCYASWCPLKRKIDFSCF